MTTFTDAVRTARAFIPIHKEISKPEYWCGATIVRKDDGRLAVYKSDAWIRPSETPFLPWSVPTGERIAEVDLCGNVRGLA